MITVNNTSYSTEQILSILSEDYSSIFVVNIDDNKIEEVPLDDAKDNFITTHLNQSLGYDNGIRKFILKVVSKREQHEMLEDTSRSNIKQQLEDKRVFTKDFKVDFKNVSNYYRLKVVRFPNCTDQLIVLLAFADISIEKQKELEYYAYVDPITEGHNYNYFKELVAANTAPGYILAMDIRSFKIVNKVCGVRTGDMVIRGIYRSVLKHLTKNDVIGHINADHFAIFLCTDDLSYVKTFVNNVTIELLTFSSRLKVPQLFPYFGVTKWKPNVRIEMLYSEAKSSKKDSKNNSKVNFSLYSESNIEQMLKNKNIEDNFEKALQNNEFEIWYQKKCNPVTGEMVGAEALVRWRQPDGSFLPPSEFIPVYEGNGMISKLDRYVFRKVCAQQREWKEKGFKLIPISINISRASLYYLDVVDIYSNIANNFNIPPSVLPIEITESATIDNRDILTIVDNFKEAGFPIHMDDFGTGYSSLATLNIIHFDTIKLDKTLIDYIGNYGGERLLEHTISLSKELGMQVVAEGVEKKEQVNFLVNLSCDIIQGYYFAKPQCSGEFEKCLALS